MFSRFFSLRSRPGQAIVLIVMAIVGLISITALAIDAGNGYSTRRRAQTGADNAALAGALARLKGWSVDASARSITNEMGYPAADVLVQNPPAQDCKGNVPDPVIHSDKNDKAEYYIQVVIRTTVETYFGPIVGVTHLNNCVSAIARAKPFTLIPPFNGNAVVGLDPNGKSFHAHSNAQKWTIKGGGAFANGNAEDDHANVKFPDGDCVTAVGTTSGFASGVCKHPGSADQAYNYPDDIIPFMPDTPACDGTAYEDGGTIYPEAGHEESGSVWADGFSGDVVDFAPGLYCLPDVNGNIHEAVSGTGVTFYITDTDFTMKYNGHGSLGGSAPTTGKYAGVLMFGVVAPTPCTQDIDIRGNGATGDPVIPIVGTIFMPSACISWLGNGEGNADRSMIIGYDVYSNGGANVEVEYNPDDQWKAPDPPAVELTH